MSSNAARVVRFPVRDSHVIPVLRRTPTFNFTRRGDAVAAMAELVAVVRRDRAHREVDAHQLASWYAPLRRLLRELKGGDPIDRVYRVLRWYADHHDDDEFIPVVESGRSLYDKFDRLEKAMLSRLPREERESPRDVLRRSVGDGRLLASFEETVYQPARLLGLAGDDLALATALGALYERLRSERAAARVPDDVKRMIGGVSDTLRGYVSWLADQEWLGKATLSSVIRSDSKAFLQYRRLAALDGAHGDPITGRKTR